MGRVRISEVKIQAQAQSAAERLLRAMTILQCKRWRPAAPIEWLGSLWLQSGVPPLPLLP